MMNKINMLKRQEMNEEYTIKSKITKVLMRIIINILKQQEKNVKHDKQNKIWNIWEIYIKI